MQSNVELPRKQELFFFFYRHSATGTVAKKASTAPRKAQPLLAIKNTQKYKFLLTNVSKMDNEPGHERKVFVLKVKTGSSLIPDEEVKLCDGPSHPPALLCHGAQGSSSKALSPPGSASSGISQRRAVSAQLQQANKKHKETKKPRGIPRGVKLLLLPRWGKCSTERAASQLRDPSSHRGASLRSQGTSAVDMGGLLLSLHYLYPSTFAFNTGPVALSLLTCLHANLDVRPWLCLSEICVNRNLLHRQGRGHSVTQGWQVKATAEGLLLLPGCLAAGTAQQGLPLPTVPFAIKDTHSQGFWGSHHC